MQMIKLFKVNHDQAYIILQLYVMLGTDKHYCGAFCCSSVWWINPGWTPGAH